MEDLQPTCKISWGDIELSLAITTFNIEHVEKRLQEGCPPFVLGISLLSNTIIGIVGFSPRAKARIAHLPFLLQMLCDVQQVECRRDPMQNHEFDLVVEYVERSCLATPLGRKLC